MNYTQKIKKTCDTPNTYNTNQVGKKYDSLQVHVVTFVVIAIDNINDNDDDTSTIAMGHGPWQPW